MPFFSSLLGPTVQRDVPFLGNPEGYNFPATQEGPYWLHDDLHVSQGALIAQTFAQNLFGEGTIGVVLVHRVSVSRNGGFYNPESKLCFIGYDKWFPGTLGIEAGSYPYYGSNAWQTELTPDTVGRDGTRGCTLSHEIGHALLPVRNAPPDNPADEPEKPAINGWQGGHDFGPVPEGTDALMRKNGGAKGKWLRHADWQTAMETLLNRMGF